ncbi:hypothetical protein CSKR_102257 [Clonorchis sinensis]|uniref:Uncharacterized protein n=1 Tax=Clonorchis sinensis TaxID=79923 RepID=A0A419PFE3_CLOSI|nr:hypothetical protein CSKR_102257 [Clonorchis sinensis]
MPPSLKLFIGVQAGEGRFASLRRWRGISSESTFVVPDTSKNWSEYIRFLDDSYHPIGAFPGIAHMDWGGGLGQPGSFLVLVLPPGGMATRRRNGVAVERLLYSIYSHGLPDTLWNPHQTAS